MATTKKSKSKKPPIDVYQKVTDKVIELLEAGVAPWRKPWTTTVPTSLATGKAYRGINIWLLEAESMINGYTSPLWGTYDQIASLGGQVRKGEKGTLVVFWKTLRVDAKDANGPVFDPKTGGIKQKTIPMLRYFKVFNLDQADDTVLPPRLAKINEATPVASDGDYSAAQAIVDGYLANGPMLVFGGDKAYYSPSLDLVKLPNRSDFATSEEFYSVMFHELTHSTGHASRLARPGVVENHFFGDPTYSKEELVAELGAAFLSGVSGLSPIGLANSASYLNSWIKTLKGDNKLVVHAAANAQKAADHIQGITWGKADEGESTEAPAPVLVAA